VSSSQEYICGAGAASLGLIIRKAISTTKKKNKKDKKSSSKFLARFFIMNPAS
jgi:hypothetical protein